MNCIGISNVRMWAFSMFEECSERSGFFFQKMLESMPRNSKVVYKAGGVTIDENKLWSCCINIYTVFSTVEVIANIFCRDL